VYYRTPYCPVERLDERTPLCNFILMADNQKVGQQGENIAAKYLRSLGYKLYRRNTRISHDEIDIVAYDPKDRVVVFAEVKTRKTSHSEYTPLLNMTGKKMRNTIRSARAWVAAHKYGGAYRIDLICVANKKIVDHIKEINFSL